MANKGLNSRRPGLLLDEENGTYTMPNESRIWEIFMRGLMREGGESHSFTLPHTANSCSDKKIIFRYH